MFKEIEPPSRFIECPHCGLSQRVIFVQNAVSVEQRCIGCDRYAWFAFPSPYIKLVAWSRRIRS